VNPHIRHTVRYTEPARESAQGLRAMTAFATESDAGLCANAKDRIIPTLERLKREQVIPHRHLVHGLTDAINMLEELCYRLESRSAK